MPDAISALYIFSLPVLFGIATGSGSRGRYSGLAFVCVLPAAYLLVQSELHGSSCAGGTCIGDGFVLIFALLLGAVAIGYIVGGIFARFSQASPGAAASGRRIFRWGLLCVILILIAKIAFVYWQAAHIHHRESAAAQSLRH